MHNPSFEHAFATSRNFDERSSHCVFPSRQSHRRDVCFSWWAISTPHGTATSRKLSRIEHNSIGEICLTDSERDCELTGNIIKPVASLRLFVMAWLHVWSWDIMCTWAVCNGDPAALNYVRGVAWPFWCCRPSCNMQVLCTVWAECVNELGWWWCWIFSAVAIISLAYLYTICRCPADRKMKKIRKMQKIGKKTKIGKKSSLQQACKLGCFLKKNTCDSWEINKMSLSLLYFVIHIFPISWTVFFCSNIWM